MKRVFLWLGSAVAALLLLLVVGAYLLVANLDIGQLRQTLEARMSEATGRAVEFESLQLSLGLKPTVEATGFRLANPEWAKQKNLVQADKVVIQMALMPLLHKEVQIENVAVVGAQIALETSREDEKSWNLKNGNQKEAVKSSAPKSDASRYKVTLARVEAKDVVLLLTNHQDGKTQKLTLTSLNLTEAPELEVDATLLYNGMEVALQAEAANHESVLQGAPVTLTVTASNPKNAKLAFKGKLKRATSAPEVAGALDVSAPSLAAFNEITGGSLPPTEALALKGQLAASPKAVALNKATLGFDDLQGTGEVSVALDQAKPFVRAKLRLPKVAVGEGGGAKQNGAAASGEASDGKAGGRVIPDLPFPTAALNRVNADITLAIGAVEAAGHTLNDVQARAVVSNGTLNANPISFAIAGGTVSGSATLGQNDAGLDLSGKSLALNQLLPDAAISGGTTAFSIALHGKGQSLRPVLATANGTLSAYAHDAAMKPKNQSVLALYRVLSGGKESGTVTVECGAAEFSVNGGLATSKTLVIDSPAARAAGGGTVNFADESLRLVLTPTPKKPGLQELAIPLKISGTLVQPKITADAAGAAQTAASIGLAFSKDRTLSTVLGAFARKDQAGASGGPCAASAPASTSEGAPSQPQPTIKDTIKSKKQQIKEFGNQFKDLKKLF